MNRNVLYPTKGGFIPLPRVDFIAQVWKKKKVASSEYWEYSCVGTCHVLWRDGNKRGGQSKGGCEEDKDGRGSGL